MCLVCQHWCHGVIMLHEKPQKMAIAVKLYQLQTGFISSPAHDLLDSFGYALIFPFQTVSDCLGLCFDFFQNDFSVIFPYRVGRREDCACITHSGVYLR